MTIYLSKQQALDPNPKLIQQINFTGNLDWGRQTALYYIIEEAKKTKIDFSDGNVEVLWIYFVSMQYQYKMISL